MLSRAWVAYASTVRAPTPGMIYGDPSVRGTGPRPDEILRAAVAAPSLAAHVKAVSDVNPIYAALRDEAEREAQLPGGGNSAKLLANLPAPAPSRRSGRFVLVDVPAARLWMYEDGRPVNSMKVVVGIAEYPTPMIASMIHYATFNPYWHVPDHLVRKTVAPAVLKQGPAYLKARGYEVVSEWNDGAIVSAQRGRLEGVPPRALLTPRCASFRAAPIRWARSNSPSPTTRASTCTTRPSRKFRQDQA